jgi:hypothetical protein
MARIHYLLKSMLIWMFILGWWTGLLVWVVATGAWPKGVLGAIVGFFWLMFWAMPTIMAIGPGNIGGIKKINGATEPGGS